MLKNDISRWRSEGGEERRVSEYTLDSDSLVFDVGGYHGDWTDSMWKRFKCNIHVFEPIRSLAVAIQNRFNNNNKIIVNQTGLSYHSKDALISIEGDGSSVYKVSKNNEMIKLVRFADYVLSKNISAIDVVKINIEGGEYDLINHLVETNFIRIITALQIQFHQFIFLADMRVALARQKLSETHKCTYSYDYVWENWVLK